MQYIIVVHITSPYHHGFNKKWSAVAKLKTLRLLKFQKRHHMLN